MARGERASRLGADARLARRVCGARAGALPSDRCALPPGPCQARAHQVTDISQAGAVIASHATRGAASRRGATDSGASCRPSAAATTPRPRHRTRHEGNHRDST